MSGCCSGETLPKAQARRRAPGSSSHSLQSRWPGAVGRGGGGERRRDQGLPERPFDGFEGLREGEPGGLNTKERLRKGEGLVREWGQGSACRKGSLSPGCGARRMQRIYLCPTLPWPRPTRKAAVRTPAPLSLTSAQGPIVSPALALPPRARRTLTSYRPGFPGVTALSISLSSCYSLNARLPEKPGVLGCQVLWL